MSDSQKGTLAKVGRKAESRAVDEQIDEFVKRLATIGQLEKWPEGRRALEGTEHS